MTTTEVKRAALVAALIRIEQSHVAFDGHRWSALDAKLIAELLQLGLVMAVQPPAWLQRLGRRYCLALTTDGYAMLPGRMR